MAVLKEADVLKVKPGQGGVRLATPRRVVIASSSLPRTVRNKSPRRKLVRPAAIPAAAGSPHAVVHEETVNAVTGKVAMGPWHGPFAAAAQEPSAGAGPAADGLIPPTIYMDSQGSCHLDLDPSGDRRLSQQLLKAQSDSGLLSDAADEAAARAAAQAAVVRREAHAQARAVRAHSALEHSALDKTPAAKAAMRRMHVINQPRRFN